MGAADLDDMFDFTLRIASVNSRTHFLHNNISASAIDKRADDQNNKPMPINRE